VPALDTLDIWWAAAAPILLLSFYYVTQGLYSLSFLVDGYLFSRPVNRVDMDQEVELVRGSKEDFPLIVLFYPVLQEEESVMRTTMIALDELDYPKDRYRVIAIPNADDGETIAAIKNLQIEFPSSNGWRFRRPIIARGKPSGMPGTTTPRPTGGITARMPTTGICRPRRPAS
jgi:hypothetical protein